MCVGLICATTEILIWRDRRIPDVRSPDGSLRDTRVYAATGLATLVEAAPHGPGGVARNEES